MSITEFYKNQVIFITGGSGFIGKALIEKLLYSCPDIAKIYVLVRAKKGKTAEERLESTKKDSCFRRLWQEYPEVFEKIQAIEGDCRKLQLGISHEDLERMRDVSIIIHSAATVRFDEPIREAILMNTRCTYELLRIAETLQNLKAFLHISTTYINPSESVIQEKVYESQIDWRDAIKIAENTSIDGELLDFLTRKISDKHPNTYTFTKNLGERIVLEYKDKLPVIIFRPSIVVSSLKEPIPGWIDNVNGPIGILIACGTGVKRCELCDGDKYLAIIPLDIVVRAIIVSGYKIGTENMCSKTEKELDVYNCALDSTAPITIKQMIRTGERLIFDYPFEKLVWAPGGIMHKTKLNYLIQVVLQQVTFALLLDGILRLTGRKPMIVKAQRILVNASKALRYFMFNEWSFKTENFFELENYVSAKEKEKFGFRKLCFIDYDKYYPDLICGMREFILNEPREPTSGALKRIRIFVAINYILQGVVIFWFLKFLYGRYIS